MRETVYVFGHKNPDTDSVCSAIAYANLKNQIDSTYKYVPAILGEPSKETKYVLDQVGIKKPLVISHLKPQVCDLNLVRPEVVRESTSIKSTLEKIINQVGRSIPVVGTHNHLIGVVSISDVLPLYMNMEGQSFLRDAFTPYKNLIDDLGLKHLCGKLPSGLILGRIILFEDMESQDYLEEDDIVFADKRFYERGELKGLRAGNLILANVREGELALESGEHRTILTTHQSVCALLKVINQIAPIQSVVRKNNLEYFTTYETLEDVRKNMLTSRFRRFPVVDENGYIQGMISKSNLLDVRQKKAILVDHNEKGQSIDGIEAVTLLEVIDHHRVADVQTMGPLYFRVEPVGCTSTIIAKMYEEQGVMIDPKMAQVMLSAILSDTLIFKSPTSTKEDERIAGKLARIAGLDIQLYGMSMIHAGSDLAHATPLSIIATDLKRFMFGDHKVMIAQTNTSDFDGVFALYPEIIKEINKMIQHEDANLFVLLITDVLVGGTEMVAIGRDKWIAEQAFGIRPQEESIFLPDVFSRKKQVVPKLMAAAQL